MGSVIHCLDRLSRSGYARSDRRSGELFSYVDVETRVGLDHPLRRIRSIVNETLEGLTGEFEAL